MKYFYLLITVTLLSGCSPNADGLFHKLQETCKWNYEVNRDGNSGNSKSIVFKVPSNGENLNKLFDIKTAIDKYLNALPKTEKGNYNCGATDLCDNIIWEEPSYKVETRTRKGEDSIRVIVFFITK